jgi:hypothetical protein
LLNLSIAIDTVVLSKLCAQLYRFWVFSRENNCPKCSQSQVSISRRTCESNDRREEYCAVLRGCGVLVFQAKRVSPNRKFCSSSRSRLRPQSKPGSHGRRPGRSQNALAKRNGVLDDPSIFGDQHNKILIYFAEVKAGQRCTINGPWSKRPRQNIPRTLRAVGCIPDERVDDAANQLYQSCYYEDERVVVRLMAVGDQLNTPFMRTQSRT